MKAGDFSDAALILFGHGTVRNSESGAAVLQHAAALRQRGLFAEVHEAFWKQEPRLQEVTRDRHEARVFFAPLFISEGYFSEQIIPAELGFQLRAGQAKSRLLRRESRTWFYCYPVGTHERMTHVLLDRARSVVSRHPFPHAPRPAETTLFLAGHGTTQDENSRLAVERQAELIRGLNLYDSVHAVYLEEAPGIDACYQLARTRNLVVVPFFAGDGLHAREDIPVLLGESANLVRERLGRGAWPWRNPTEKRGKLVWYSESAGTDPLVAEVVLARVREAAEWC